MTTQATTYDGGTIEPEAAPAAPAAAAPRAKGGHAAKYRPDIDGLRAIAVSSVVAYHYDVPMVKGGFVGVDIFFVISGFLISSIIITEVLEKRFSYVDFYERRIRRIIPALMAMLLTTLAIGLLFLMPSELVDLSKSAIAAMASGSNIFFWSTSDYFAVASSTRPLLHTWSLGVEEQFYIFYPPLLIAVVRWAPRYFKHVLVAAAIVSLIFCIATTFSDAQTAFYLTPYRAWELLLGALIFCDVVPPRAGPRLRNAVAAIGLVLIVGTIFRLDKTTPFPGYAAIPPVLGSAMLIYAGRCGETWVGRLLSLRPVVFIGLISYSWYLWHWPLWVFQSTVDLFGVGESIFVRVPVLFAVSLIAATLSWRFVEKPFRSKRDIGRKAVFTGAAFITVVTAGAAAAFVGMDGLSQRFPADAVKVAKYLDYSEDEQFRSGQCFISSRNRLDQFDEKTCLGGRPHTPRYLLIGDSHAAQLWWGLSHVYPEASILQATASGCLPTARQPAYATPTCAAFFKALYPRLPQVRPDAVLLSARWNMAVQPALADTIDVLKAQGQRVIVIGPIFEYDTPLPRLLAQSIVERQPAIPDEHIVAKVYAADKATAALAKAKGVGYVSLVDLLCAHDTCLHYAEPGVPMQFDASGHVTREGSMLLARKMGPLIGLGVRPNAPMSAGGTGG